jgi:hypothetical protein
MGCSFLQGGIIEGLVGGSIEFAGGVTSACMSSWVGGDGLELGPLQPSGHGAVPPHSRGKLGAVGITSFRTEQQ